MLWLRLSLVWHFQVLSRCPAGANFFAFFSPNFAQKPSLRYPIHFFEVRSPSGREKMDLKFLPWNFEIRLNEAFPPVFGEITSNMPSEVAKTFFAKAWDLKFLPWNCKIGLNGAKIGLFLRFSWILPLNYPLR